MRPYFFSAILCLGLMGCSAHKADAVRFPASAPNGEAYVCSTSPNNAIGLGAEYVVLIQDKLGKIIGSSVAANGIRIPVEVSLDKKPIQVDKVNEIISMSGEMLKIDSGEKNYEGFILNMKKMSLEVFFDDESQPRVVLNCQKVN